MATEGTGVNCNLSPVPTFERFAVPIFGNNTNGTPSLALTDIDLFGHFDGGLFTSQGNPVPGGDMVSCSVRMTGPPFGQPNATVQLGVYDVTVNGPPAYTLVATSATFGIAAGLPIAAWYTVPIAGALVPGNSYATAVISWNGGAFSGSVLYRTKTLGPSLRSFITPGVFPNPLAVATSSIQEWSLYTTYILPDGGIAAVSAGCCDC